MSSIKFYFQSSICHDFSGVVTFSFFISIDTYFYRRFHAVTSGRPWMKSSLKKSLQTWFTFLSLRQTLQSRVSGCDLVDNDKQYAYHCEFIHFCFLASQCVIYAKRHKGYNFDEILQQSR